MTFTFDTATIDSATLTFNVPNGPSLAYLQLWSQAANQQLVGQTTDPLNWWAENSQGMVMELVYANERYSEYKFKYATFDGLDDFSAIFTKDVRGIYNYKLNQFTTGFLWNLNNNLYNLESRPWSYNDSLVEVPMEIGVIKIKNVEPTSEPNKKTYVSSNEQRTGYVYLNNQSL